jgi:hypothetical protein
MMSRAVRQRPDGGGPSGTSEFLNASRELPLCAHRALTWINSQPEPAGTLVVCCDRRSTGRLARLRKPSMTRAGLLKTAIQRANEWLHDIERGLVLTTRTPPMPRFARRRR